MYSYHSSSSPNMAPTGTNTGNIGDTDNFEDNPETHDPYDTNDPFDGDPFDHDPSNDPFDNLGRGDDTTEDDWDDINPLDLDPEPSEFEPDYSNTDTNIHETTEHSEENQHDDDVDDDDPSNIDERDEVTQDQEVDEREEVDFSDEVDFTEEIEQHEFDPDPVFEDIDLDITDNFSAEFDAEYSGHLAEWQRENVLAVDAPEAEAQRISFDAALPPEAEPLIDDDYIYSENHESMIELDSLLDGVFADVFPNDTLGNNDFAWFDAFDAIDVI